MTRLVLVTRKRKKSEDSTWSPKTPKAGPSMSKVSPCGPTHDSKEFGSSRMQQGVRSIPQSKLRKETTPRWNQSPRYESGFNGYCYFCSNFGHKAMDCRFYGRIGGRPNDLARCWTCNQVGHVVATCHTLRCYTYSGFGHKAQECSSQRIQPRRIPSYTSTRRTN